MPPDTNSIASFLDEVANRLAAVSAGDDAAPNTVIVVGRSPTSDIVVPDPSVSRRHVEIGCVGAPGGTVTATDLGSSNGTCIERGTDRIRLVPGEPFVLESGDCAVTSTGIELYRHHPSSLTEELTS